MEPKHRLRYCHRHTQQQMEADAMTHLINKTCTYELPKQCTAPGCSRGWIYDTHDCDHGTGGQRHVRCDLHGENVEQLHGDANE